MTALQPIINLVDGNTPHQNTQADAASYFTDERAYLAGLLGSDGTLATARKTLLVPGALGTVYTSTGVASDPTWQTAASGSLVQRVFVLENSSAISTASIIPFDNTTPQSTEGAQALSLSITPTSASNYLRVSWILNCGADLSTIFIAALFRDSASNASSSSVTHVAANTVIYPLTGELLFAAGSTNSTTFKIRIGSFDGNTVYLNRDVAGAKLQSTQYCSMVIDEYTP